MKNKKDEKISTLQLYDWILSNHFAEKLNIDSTKVLDNEEMSVEWGRLVTNTHIMKAFVIEKYNMWITPGFIENVKSITLNGVYTVKFDYFLDLKPHKINWDSAKMKQQREIWSRIMAKDNTDANDIFKRRDTYGKTQYMAGKAQTFEYYNQADLENRRTIFKTSLFIVLSGQRDSLDDLDTAIANFKAACSLSQVKYHEFHSDLFDWYKNQCPTSMRVQQDVERKMPKTVMTDDTITMLQGSSQGKIGEHGIPLGLDVYSSLPVLHVFREDKSKAENILITAGTGGGKSVFVKDKLLWALKEGLSVCILDYEGDEYINLAKVINEGHPGDAVVVDMGSGNNRYFDPLRMSAPVGEPELDNERKSQATDFTKAIFKLLIGEDHGNNQSTITLEEDAILSQVITKVYSEHGITDNPMTWKRSSNLKINMVYETLERMVEVRTYFIDKSGDDSLQRVAKKMLLKLKKYFVEGESDYGLFGEVLTLDKIRQARLVIFSFGNKGRDTQGGNTIKMALKQITVSKITNEISNYNRYIKNTFTIKIWEEVQRFVNISGAEDIMTNCITGGRKRGDIAFIITNNLGQLLEGKSDFMKALKDNLTGYCVGYIPTLQTRQLFCETFGLQLFERDLTQIYEATSATIEKTSTGEIVDSPFKSAFLVKFNPTSKSPAIQTIVKACIAPPLFEKNIFDPGKLEDNLEMLI